MRMTYDESLEEAAKRVYAQCGWRKVNGLIQFNTHDMYDRYHSIAADDKDARHIQKLITHTVEQSIYNDLFNSGSDVDKARMTALKQPHAMLTERISRSLFIQQSNLSDYNVVQRNRMVVGLPPTNTVQKCKCGKLLDSRHALSCVETRKVCLEPRHDMVRDAIKGALDRYNISSIIEYRPLSHDLSAGKLNRIRPDGC